MFLANFWYSIEQWREDSLPQSKIAFEALRRDVEQQHAVHAEILEHGRPRAPGERLQIRASAYLHMPIVDFHIRAAQKFWLDYSIGGMALHGGGLFDGGDLVRSECALSLQSQAVNFIAVNDSRLQGEGAPFGGESIHFPAVLVSAKYTGQVVEILASLERIALTLTAGILDSALTVQKRFEHDIDEILAVFTKHKTKRKSTEMNEQIQPEFDVALLKWSGHLILRGLNLGLKGPLSTQFIGADLVDGYISHTPGEECGETQWEARASNLALSLAQDAVDNHTRATASAFDRTYRLAYFVLDIQAGNRVAEVEELKELTNSDLGGDAQTSHLHIKVAKTHAVMQTAAIEALDDLLEHCKANMAFRTLRSWLTSWYYFSHKRNSL